jgi:hypothetical protein
METFDLKLEMGSPSKVFMRRGQWSAQGYGMGFVEELANQMRAGIGPALGTAVSSSQSISIGQMYVDSRLAQREHDLWERRQNKIAQRTMLSALERFGR